MGKMVFLCAGEGAHGSDSDLSILKLSPAWEKTEKVLRAFDMDIDDVMASAGEHSSPTSPLLTTVINICLIDLWKSWGHEPHAAIGHSVGEIAAAYCCGMYDVEQALKVGRRVRQSSLSCLD